MSENDLDQVKKPEKRERSFLVVVDDTAEMKNALRYACRRAQRSQGRVALVYVIEPVEFQHWLGVGRIMEADARTAAEQRLQALAGEVHALTGTMPMVHIREGKRAEEVMKLIHEDPSISVLVLGTAVGATNPGPLVSYVTSNFKRLRVPITLVPGELTTEEIDALT